MIKVIWLGCTVAAGVLVPPVAGAHPGHGPDDPLAHAVLHSGWSIAVAALCVALVAVAVYLREARRRDARRAR
jgi:hypothetical protein